MNWVFPCEIAELCYGRFNEAFCYTQKPSRPYPTLKNDNHKGILKGRKGHRNIDLVRAHQNVWLVRHIIWDIINGVGHISTVSLQFNSSISREIPGPILYLDFKQMSYWYLKFLMYHTILSSLDIKYLSQSKSHSHSKYFLTI